MGPCLPCGPGAHRRLKTDLVGAPAASGLRKSPPTLTSRLVGEPFGVQGGPRTTQVHLSRSRSSSCQRRTLQENGYGFMTGSHPAP